MWVVYHAHRNITTLHGLCQLTLVVRRCGKGSCGRSRQASRAEEEGRWALPHGECGLDLIALVGTLRYREHRSVPKMHQALLARGISIAQRSVTHLM